MTCWNGWVSFLISLSHIFREGYSIRGVFKEWFIYAIDSYRFLEKYPSIVKLFRKNKPEYLPDLENLQNSISPVYNPLLIFVKLN